jgi:BolA protein
MDIINSIKIALMANFKPKKLEIEDESHKHAGHAGHGEYSHLWIKISAAPFAGMSRVERERALRQLVLKAAARDIHALRFEFLV